MRHLWALLCAICFLLVAASSFPQAKNSSSQPPATASSGHAEQQDDNDSADVPPFARGRIDEKDYLRLREQQIGKLRGVNGLARNPQARSRAVRTMNSQEQLAGQKRAQGATRQAIIPAVGITWTPLGPDPIPNGQVQSPPEVPVSGRVTAIALDTTDTTGNTVYVGTAQGGLYRSLDGGNTWTALMDGAESLAIGALTLDPTDHTVLFVGTGEGNFSLDSFFGVGLYIITNANSTSSITPPAFNGPFNAPTTSPDPDGFSDVFTGRAISQILVNPGNHSQILVSTTSGFSGASGETFSTLPTRGVYLSTNVFASSSPSVVGTPTFQRLSIQPASAVANRPVTDMVMDPGNSNLVLVNVMSLVQGETFGGIWSSPTTLWAGTGTWTQVLATGVDVNARFTVNRSGTPTATTFFAGLDQTVTSGACASAKAEGTLFRSVATALSTWTEIPAARGFCGRQCFYDITVATDPGNVNTIYLGGSFDGGSTPACTTNTFLKSTNGSTFSRSDAQLHADSHATAILPSNTLIIYTGNDGGIFRSDDGGSTWNSLNSTGFTATQFESVAVHPTDPNFTIGGTQDNGTPMLMPDGVTWFRADAGDGGFSAIDQNATNTSNVIMYHTYSNLPNVMIGYAQISSGISASEGNWNVSGCVGDISGNGIGCTDVVNFYAPLVLGPGNPNTVYFGTDRLYRSNNEGVSNTVVSQVPIVSNAPISAVGISSLSDNIRIVGLGDDATTGAPVGRVFATMTGASTLNEITGPWTPQYVGRAVIDPNNPNTAYVTFDGYGTSTHVWKTTNLSASSPTWAPASGSGANTIPDVPVNSLVVDPQDSSVLYAATDIGVYNSVDGGNNWAPYGAGLPRVAVFDLQVTAKRTIRIATHGKGMWEISAVAAGAATTIAASANPSSAGVGANVALKAAVNHTSGVAIPTGTVAFMDGPTLLGSAAVGATGSATLTVTFPTGGTHNVLAAYGGDSNYAASQGSTSAAIADFSLSLPTTTASVQPGQAATYTINVSAGAGFSGTVTFACTAGIPSLASCAFNPTSVSTSGSTTLTISTTAPTSAATSPNSSASLVNTCGLIGLGLVVAGGAAVKKRRVTSLFMFIGLLGLMTVAISCSNHPTPTPSNPGTPAGTSTVTITATSGTSSHTATVTLIVQ